jgi:gamma-glutamyl-gamma-aminobutyraldehyde dehydrogenase
MALTQSNIDGLRSKPVRPQGLFIKGRSVASRDGATLDVRSPIDGSLLTTIADAHEEDVSDAAMAARSTFEGGAWSRTLPAERKRLLLRLADLIETHALELAVLGVRDNGTEISMAYKAEP